MARPAFTSYSEVPGKPGLYRFERGTAPPIDLYGEAAEAEKRRLDAFNAAYATASNAHQAPPRRGPHTFETFDNATPLSESGYVNRAMAQDADRPDPVPQTPLEQSAYDYARNPMLNPDRARVESGERKELQERAEKDPRKGSAAGTLARSAVTRTVNALASPVVLAGQALEKVGVPNEAAHLDAAEALADAESLARDEHVAQSRERARIGREAYPTAAAIGDVTGDVTAGAVMLGAQKALPSARTAIDPTYRPPGMSDAAFAARQRRMQRGVVNLDGAKGKAQAKAVQERNRQERNAGAEEKTYWRVQDADSEMAQGHKSIIGAGPAREEGTSALPTLKEAVEWANTTGRKPGTGGFEGPLSRGDVDLVKVRGSKQGSYGADGEPLIDPARELRRIRIPKGTELKNVTGELELLDRGATYVPTRNVKGATYTNAEGKTVPAERRVFPPGEQHEGIAAPVSVEQVDAALRRQSSGMREESMAHLRGGGEVSGGPPTVAVFPGEQPHIVDGRHRIAVAAERGEKSTTGSFIEYDADGNIVRRLDNVQIPVPKAQAATKASGASYSDLTTEELHKLRSRYAELDDYKAFQGVEAEIARRASQPKAAPQADAPPVPIPDLPPVRTSGPLPAFDRRTVRTGASRADGPPLPSASARARESAMGLPEAPRRALPDRALANYGGRRVLDRDPRRQEQFARAERFWQANPEYVRQTEQAAEFFDRHPDTEALTRATHGNYSMNTELRTHRERMRSALQREPDAPRMDHVFGGVRGGTSEVNLSPDTRASRDAVRRILGDAVNAGHGFKGTAYRGVRVPDEVLADWLKAGHVRQESMWSASANQQIAPDLAGKAFAGEKALELRLHGKSGVPIEGISEFAHEHEIAFPPGRNWRIKSTQTADDGRVIIDLEEVDTIPKGVDAPHSAIARASDQRLA